MELDTEAPCSIINHNEFRRNLAATPLINSIRRFASYTGHVVNCMARECSA